MKPTGYPYTLFLLPSHKALAMRDQKKKHSIKGYIKNQAVVLLRQEIDRQQLHVPDFACRDASIHLSS